MTTRTHPEAAARHALWMGGLLVVLSGLFGMHGLAGHGASGMESVPQSVMTEPAMSGVGAVDEAKSSVHGVGSAVATASAAAGHPAMDMGMAGMCLAVLAVGLIALLRLLHRARVHPVLWVLARSARAPGYRVRDLAPPSLIALSIRRC